VDRALCAVAPDGTVRFRANVGTVLGSPSVDDVGTAYIGVHEEGLTAIAPSGAVAWRFTPADAVQPYWAGTALWKHTVMAGCSYASPDAPNTYRGYLVGVSTNGAGEWEVPLAGEPIGYPAVDERGWSFLLVNHDRLRQAELDAVSPTHRVAWRFPIHGLFHSGSPVVAPNGTILAASETDGLYCLDRSGRPKWHVRLNGRIVGTPAVDLTGTAYIGTSQNQLYAISSAGVVNWEHRLSTNPRAQIWSSPAVDASGNTYLGLDRDPGPLFAVGRTGLPIWTFPNEVAGGEAISSDQGVWGSPAFGKNGRLYVMQIRAGRLYAFQ
jgi:outer membrane protein assembly factor BamB